MALRLSTQAFIFGGVFFMSKSLLGSEGQKKVNSAWKPQAHVRILIYLAYWLLVISITESLAGEGNHDWYIYYQLFLNEQKPWKCLWKNAEKSSNSFKTYLNLA